MIDLTPLLSGYAWFRRRTLRAQNAREAQRNQLRRLLNHCRETRFGRDHNFSSIKEVADFQVQVPLRYYEDFWKEYWEKSFPIIRDSTWPGLIPYYAVTSGTTSGTTKYIPYTVAMERSNVWAGLDLLTHHISNRPNSHLLAGRNFMLGGNTTLVTQAPGVFSGDLSGIAARNLPFWARGRYFPPAEITSLSDWEVKIGALARAALKADLRMIGGVPSWLLLFFKAVFDAAPHAENDLSKAFPKLEIIVHGGVNFAPYQSQFADLLKNTKAELREVYPASEGFIAIADRGSDEGLKLILDHGIFFEFVPLEELGSKNPTRHWIENVEPDVQYAIVMSTCAGMWAYVLGDTVRFTDVNPHRLVVTGRTSYMLSAFGEHLIAEEIEKAISFAARAIGRNVSDYSVGPVYPATPSELGGHLYVVEFAESLPTIADQEKFLKLIDEQLSLLNEDYSAHRAKGFGLNPPRALLARTGTFTAWMKKRGKLGGQHKVPRIITDVQLFDDLKSFVAQSTD